VPVVCNILDQFGQRRDYTCELSNIGWLLSFEVLKAFDLCEVNLVHQKVNQVGEDEFSLREEVRKQDLLNVPALDFYEQGVEVNPEIKGLIDVAWIPTHL